MAKLSTATGGGCLATATIAVDAASFQSLTVSARAGAAVAASAATPRSAPRQRTRAGVRSVGICLLVLRRQRRWGWRAPETESVVRTGTSHSRRAEAGEHPPYGRYRSGAGACGERVAPVAGHLAA